MQAAPRILLLEDDPAIARTVAFALEREGFAVEQVLLVGVARERLAAEPPALAILDVGLPDGSGLDLCRTLRHGGDARLAHLPILMLTARNEELDRVLGLELGADDYMAKPFSPRELVARVRALLRRATAPAPAPAAAPLFELDAAGQRVRFAGEVLALTRLEYALLRTLLVSPGRIVSREALFVAAWGPHSEAGDRTVDTHVKTLRAKLRALRPDLEPIVTHRGMGYELVIGTGR
ncbi:two-component system response regulator CreB [Aquincola sp. S2]|uniref:Two-component system response regulator CreB n=1 Tax=Pseudaquabacterium terrae TaxID=2732868 RepID=A0ABX2EKU5_9BURK|nr:two-component system response regulator CreB [Aquabacterium terrae]NRF69276.1 two-component system response regulator CreB [Aquabacterium terrae]